MASKLLEEHRALFGTDKPVIGCLHMMALPGSPYYTSENTLESQIKRLNHDAEIFMDLGFDAVVFANEGDRPYLNQVGPETVANYTRIATEVSKKLTIPYGCGVLIDPYASIAVAHAIGAKFIRTYVSNAYVGSFGPQAYCPGEIFRYRKQIDAEEVHVYTYFEAHGGTCLDSRTTEQQIEAGFGVMPLAGMLIGGPHAGLPPEEAHFINIKKAFPDIPLILGSGSNKDNISTLLKYADGVIVGTSIKRDGNLYNEVDYDRAKAFIEAAKKAK